MKKIVRVIAREAASLYITYQIASGIAFTSELEGLIATGAALAVATYLVRPIVNILFLPLTLVTLGLFKFLTNAVTLYLVDLALPQFAIVGFHFAGFSSSIFDVPPVDFGSGPLAYIAFSVIISIISYLLS